MSFLQGLATYPCDYGAYLTVFSGRIKVQMQPLPSELAVPNNNAVGFRGTSTASHATKRISWTAGAAGPNSTNAAVATNANLRSH